MIYLLTRPIAWLFKLLMTIVKAPYKFVISIRDHRARKHAKIAAQAVKAQAKEAKEAAKQAAVAPAAAPAAEPPSTPAV